MKVKEIKEFLRFLVYRELEQEYQYQENGGDIDKEYLAKLIMSYGWLIKNTSLPIIESTIINDMVEKYLKN